MVTETVTIVIRERGAKVTSRGIQSVGRASRSAADSVGLLATALAGLGAVLGTRALIQFSDAAVQIQNRVKVTTQSVDEYNAALVRLRDISNGTRTNLQDNAGLFQRLSTATRDLGTAQSDVLDVVEGLNAAIAVSGTSSTEAAAGVLQLAQGLASGRFQGDELRSVIENLNPLAQRLADELGVTVGELRELGAAGELNAQTVFPALQRAVRGFREELDGIQFTTEQTFNVLRNEFTIAVGAINQVLEASGFLNDGILTLADNIGNVLVQGVAFLVDAFAETLQAGGAVTDLLNDIGIEVLPNLSQGFRALAQTVILFIRSFETGIQAIRAAGNAVSTALQSVTNALGLSPDERFAEQIERFNQAQQDFVASADNTNSAIAELGNTFEEIAREGSPTANASERFEELSERAKQLGVDLRQLVADGRITIPEFTGDGDANIAQGVEELETPGENILGDGTEEGNVFGKAFGEAASDTVGRIFRGQSVNIWDVFAGIGSDLVSEALEKTFTDLGNFLGEQLQGALDNLGLGGLGGTLGALAGAGLAIGIGAARDTSAQTRNSLVRTAVESAQATRGVIAGPQSVPIFQIGASLETAFIPTEELLQQILDAILAGNAQRATAGASAGGTLSPGETLTTNSALLS